MNDFAFAFFAFFFFLVPLALFMGGLWTVTHTVHARGLHCARDIMHCSRDPQPLYSEKIFKMGLTVLFTHLKIILLQCFQFSAKLFCWKHCSKIIFRCVNNAVGPIFNEKSYWKVRFMGPVNSARGPLVLLKSQILRLKKKGKCRRWTFKRSIQTLPKSSFLFSLIKCFIFLFKKYLIYCIYFFFFSSYKSNGNKKCNRKFQLKQEF